MERLLTPRELRTILARYDVGCDESRGKGSHWLFFRKFPEGTVSYPVPTTSKEVARVYVRQCRRRFRLTEADGVSDRDFYGD
ncbi:type II toxin-antitoxin system HicA family toxin [Paludisphaera rhizosphaerae]|uniref:type II toxin-antitoxin system HicA family toxin n=1 Tax=Paludisphaera rhizosphaerae TaxID=2711216 RepID=UPI0013E9EAFD|nr:type II toxin-antitoxin system HicA family toxin [Paludisphaera rhizosphaerae]